MALQLYVVGGAVRDELLGRPPTDRDWVAVGTTPDELIALGYKPVGRDFPVFLHPLTREEVALARTERKTAPGYHGFVFHAAPDVTLEQDLARRDLTINAMARDERGTLIDPFGGARDLRDKVLRHVSEAFAEDPVRLLRVARFAARLPDFTLAPATRALLRRMVEAGEVDALVPERVWQELSRGLMEARPSRLLDVLRDSGALARLLPEVDRLFGVPQRPEHHPEVDTGEHLRLVLDIGARLQAPLPVRFAALLHDVGKGSTPAQHWPRHHGHEAAGARLAVAIAERLRAGNECRDLAELAAREHGNVHRSASLDATALMRLLERCDALRRPERFEQLLLACECDMRGRLGHAERPYPERPRLSSALRAALAVDSAGVAARAAAQGLAGPQIGQRVRMARIAAIAAHDPVTPAAGPAADGAPSAATGGGDATPPTRPS